MCRMPFGLPVDAGGVEDEERMLGCRARPARSTGDASAISVVPPEVALPAHRATALPMRRTTTTLLDRRRLRLSASSTLCFERHGCPAAPAAVGGDDDLGLGVVDAVGDGVGAEAAEDRPSASRRCARRPAWR